MQRSMQQDYTSAWQFPRKLVRFLAMFSLCCVFVVACQGSTPQGQDATTSTGASDNGRIVLGTTGKIRTLDPADSYEILSGNLLYNLGDRLYTNQLGSTELEPQLATALPEISEDGLVYTIPLREGVVFHDGEPFNAEAMAFSLQRFSENGGPPAFLLSDTVETVEATGEFELTITLQSPFAAFTSLLAFPGLAAVSPAAYTLGAGEFEPEAFVGTGPYQLVEYRPDSLKLDVFPDYWGEQPLNQGLDLQIFSSSANLFSAISTGAVDLGYQTLDPEQIRNLAAAADQGRLQMIESLGNGIHYLSVNVLSPPLDNKEVRQAIAAAMDRTLLNERVFQGQVEPLYSLLPTKLPSYEPTFETQYGDGTNPQRAIALLQEAGYSESNPLVLDFWYRSNINSNVLASSTIKAIIDDRLGGIISVNLNGVESATAYENLDKGAYPIFMLDWAPDFLDPDNYLQPFVDCAEGSDATGCELGASQYQGAFYYNSRVNELIVQQRQEQDPAARQALLSELQEIIAEDVPFIPLWENKEFLFAQSDIQGANIQPTQNVAFWTITR
ncbi:MAG: ABC transporter substrate-binding protein [Cyanobacteria bacterium P01_H01_bin.121]